jgi:N-methylhydantoinase B
MTSTRIKATSPDSSAPGRASADGLDLEIFRHLVTSITEEIEINITRTAYTFLIYECKDYAVGFLTNDFRLFAQSGGSIPVFVAGLGEPVMDAVQLIGESDLEPGDVLVTNFSDITGQHVNNVIVAAPLFDSDGVVGYLAVRSHWADLGGLVMGGQSYQSRSVFHEGTRYRGLRIMRRGRVAPEVLATFQANTWQPEMLTGDLMAQLAACTLVARRWEEQISRRWTPGQVRTLINAGLEASAAFARRAVAALPDGDYEAEKPWTFAESGVTVDLTSRIKITVAGERMVVDLSGLPAQTELPINSGAIGGGLSAIRVGFKHLISPDWPIDDGFFAPLEVLLPEGTVASARPNAPVAHWNSMMAVIIDLFLRAIGLSRPELVSASHNASQGGLILRGRRPDGTVWFHADGATGGLGADKDANGFGPVKNLMYGDFRSVPIELIEKRFPLVVHSFKLDRTSGGSGTHRGGPGTDRVTEVLTDVEYDAQPELTEPAQGLAGGGPGKLGGVTVLPAGGAEWEEPPRTHGLKRLPAGSLVRHRSGGGGGWGAPNHDASASRPDPAPPGPPH